MAEAKKIKYNRVEYEKIGDTVYEVLAEEKDDMTETPSDIVKRLIFNKLNSKEAELTCYLKTNGGNKQ